MSFISDMKERGYFYQCTNLEALEKLTDTKKITAYIGFDCTAQSLHIGNLMQVMILRLLQQHGHKPIVIIGGATSKIGDPGGRDESRKMLSPEALKLNMEGIKKSLSKFIKFGEGASDALMINNSDWLETINYIDFLSKYGHLFSVNRMLSMDSVKSRLERDQPLTFLEFNYMLLQSYDFSYLSQHYNCCLQMGGSDQWGNIVMGVDFTRKITDKEVFGLTTPLLTTSSGAKMGKSVGGAVWLNEEMLSPYDYFQYWRNCEDLDTVRFAKLYAEMNKQELVEFALLSDKDINSAKKHLAYRLTSMCHSQVAADIAAETSRKVFEESTIDDNLLTFFIDKQRFETGVPAFELFHEVGLVDSRSEGRNLIRGGGGRIFNTKIEAENRKIRIDDFKGDLIKISSGKKKHVLIKLK
ncbi:MAG: tyrosine--tRNA ligase [Janthinobacterium lividum]